MTKAQCIAIWSPTQPMSNGPTAPPTGVIIRKDEALLVWLPNPLNDKAKIVGNMIASKAYPQSKADNEKYPTSSNTRSVVATVPVPHQKSNFYARTLPIIQLPTKRPTINSPKPPNERMTDASRAFIHSLSVT